MSRQPIASKKPAQASTSPGVQPQTGTRIIESKPGPDDVRRRAYEVYLERTAKGRPGNELSDWLQAERDLKNRK